MTKILLIEDDSEVRIPIQKALKQAGFKVKATHSAERGLRLFKSIFRSYDLIITDIILPKINGIELIREIRKLDPSINTIVMTSGGPVKPTNRKSLDKAANLYLDVAEKAGANLTINKPIDLQELVEQVSALISKK